MYLKATNILTDEKREYLKNKINNFEKNVDAELVVCVSTESAPYDRSEAVVGIFCGGFFLYFQNYVFQYFNQYLWDSLQAQILSQLSVFILGFVIGNFLASYLHGIRRLFTRKINERDEVHKAALSLFGKFKHQTETKLLLIYISLYECEVEILGDPLLMKNVPQQKLEDIKDAIIMQFRQKKYSQGIEDAVTLSQEELKKDFYTEEERKDIIANDIYLFHPRVIFKD